MLSNALNGTSVFLRVKTDSQWLTIGGQLSHSFTMSNSAIDVTSKGSSDYREILAGEGLKTLDATGNMIFSTDEAFTYCKQAFVDKDIVTFQGVRGTIGEATDDVLEFKAMITSWAESAPLADKTTADITLSSSEEWEDNLQFEQFFAAGGVEFLTSDGDKVYVRV